MKTRPGIATFVVLLACIPLLSCALLPRGASDEELVRRAVDQFCQGFNDKDVDKIASILSEDYVGVQGERKEEMIDSLAGFFNIDDLTFDLSEAEIEVDGDSASVSPIHVTSSMFDVDVEVTATKVGKKWLVSGTEMSY